MNYLNDCFHRWHCASGSRKDYLLPCSNGIPLQDLKRLYLWISNTVAYRDPENGSLAIGQGQVYMPHKRSWGKFKVPFLCNDCLDNQFRSASFDLQRLKLWILFTGHTSMAYDRYSVSNGSGPSLRVQVRVRTEPLPNWRSGLSTHPNCEFGYGSMQISQPVWIGRVVSGSPSGSICRFI